MISAKHGCPVEHLDLISDILGKPHHMFDVMHREENVYLLYAKRDVDASGLRGPIVDVETKAIVSPSASEKYDVVTDKLETNAEGHLHFNDTDGKIHVLKNYQLFYGFQGTIVRVFKRKGKVSWATGKTLSFQDKSWGNHAITFGKMWQELHGPTENELFTGETSSHVYQFLMVHKHLQVASRFTVMNPGFIILMSKEKTCWDVEDNCPYEAPNIVSEFSHEITEPFVCPNAPCNLEQANAYLHYGLRPDLPVHEDARLTNGEFIFVRCLDTGNNYQVNSTSYQYRSSLRIKPYLYDAFYEHFNAVLISEKTKKEVASYKAGKNKECEDILTKEVFLETYIPLKDCSYPIITPVTMDNVKWPIKSVGFAIKLIFKCFLYSLPPVLQVEYKHIHDEYLSTKKYVSNKICQAYRQRIHCDNKRVITIINQAKKYAAMGKGNESSSTFENNVTYLVDHELVFSLLAIEKYLSDVFSGDEASSSSSGSMEIKFIEKSRSYIPGYAPEFASRKKHHTAKPRFVKGNFKKFPEARKEVVRDDDPTPGEITIVNPT